jgi:hypothetical protein
VLTHWYVAGDALWGHVGQLLEHACDLELRMSCLLLWDLTGVEPTPSSLDGCHLLIDVGHTGIFDMDCIIWTEEVSNWFNKNLRYVAPFLIVDRFDS